MEGLQVSWFCRCLLCERVLTGNLDVAACKCPQFYCQVCTEKQPSGYYCETCASQCFPRGPEFIQRIAQLYKGVINFYKSNRSKPHEAYGPIQELIRGFYAAVTQAAGANQDAAPIQPVPPAPHMPAYEPPSANPPPIRASYEQQPAYFSELPQHSGQFPVCRHCGGTLGLKGRCQDCRKVTLEQVGFDRQAFLANKWDCPQCSFRNVHSSDRCVNCEYIKAAVYA